MAWSLFLGFAASFLTLLFSAYMRGFVPMRGQLVAGNAVNNREMPTTLNMMHRSFDGTDPVIASLSSFGWWIAVIILGSILSFILFRLTRRYA